MKAVKIGRLFCIVVMTLLVGCGGGGGSSGGSGITINGKVYEPFGSSWVPSAKVTVTLRSSDNVAILTTISSEDGSYKIENAPISTDIYINVSKNGYASFNTRILNATQNLSGNILIMSEAEAKDMVDAFYGSVGSTSWSDPFYANMSWFGMDIYDDSGHEMPNVTVTPTPTGPIVKYNNGLDTFTTATSTRSSLRTPLMGGYNTSPGIYSLTFDRCTSQSAKLPLVKGEITYSSQHGSYTGNQWPVKSLNMDLNSIVWSGTQYVAVGNEGAIGTSADGVTWVRRESGVTSSLYDIVWTGSKYIAVGPGVLISSDGVTWRSAQSPVQGVHLKCIVWTGSLFVAGGVYGEIVTSLDGDKWFSQGKVINNEIVKVIWTGSHFLGLGSSAEIITSADGITWANHPQSLANYYGLTWSGTQFVRVGTYGKIQSSPDGISWSDHFVASNYTFHCVTWSGTQFAAVGQSSSETPGAYKIFTSPDGKTWTGHDPGAQRALNLNSVIWNGSNFIAVGSATTVTSPDGVTWTVSASYNRNDLYKVKWLGNRYVAVGSNGTILTSPDGAAWSTIVSGTKATLYDISASGSRFVVVGENGTIITSTDLVNWSSTPSVTGKTLLSLIWTGNKFVAVGASSILTSPDGLTWSESASATTAYLCSVAWSGSRFVAVGYNTILTSPNGLNWTTSTSQVTNTLYSVVYFKDQFVAVGDKGVILTSPDGLAWMPQSSLTSTGLSSIAASNTELAAVGGGGTVITSYDGVLWQVQQGFSPISGPWYSLKGAASSGEGFITVGSTGYILCSK